MKYSSDEARRKAEAYLDGRIRYTLYLGGLYIVDATLVRFIKVTEKGFNFLNETTNKCVLKRHIYSRKHHRLPLPKNITQVHVFVPYKIWEYKAS